MSTAHHGTEVSFLQGTFARARFPISLPFGHDRLQLLLLVSHCCSLSVLLVLTR